MALRAVASSQPYVAAHLTQSDWRASAALLHQQTPLTNVSCVCPSRCCENLAPLPPHSIIAQMVERFAEKRMPERPRANSGRPCQRRRHWRYLGALASGAYALALYVATAAPGLTWAHDGADGGDLISAAMTWGVPHPPGYPTYCLLARLHSLLPLGSIARRFNLFSSSAAAASTALVYLCARRVIPPNPRKAARVIPLLASLAWASSQTLWSQAVISEVYTLEIAFFAACLLIPLHANLLRRVKYWALLGFTLGLGLGAHVTLILILPGLLLLVWHMATRNHTVGFCVGVALGVSVYLYVPLAGRGDSPVIWGDPTTWRGLWWIVSGKPYRGFLFGLPLVHLPSRLAAWLQLWRDQFSVVGLLLGALGLWSWAETGRRRWALGTGTIVISYSIFAVMYDTTDSYVYLLPTYTITVLWITEGARVALDEISRRGRGKRPYGFALGLALLAAIPIWSVLAGYPTLDLSTDREATKWLDSALAELPVGALLITGEDRHTFALEYARWVEKRRRDLVVIDGELLQYTWYVEELAKRHPTLRLGQSPNPLETLISENATDRPIYLASPRPELDGAASIEPAGALWRLRAKPQDGDRLSLWPR